MIILSYTLGMIDTIGNGSEHMLDRHRGQPGWLLQDKACHQHAEICLRQETRHRRMMKPAADNACPAQESLIFCQTTTRHTSRAFLPARRECAGCFANATFPEAESDARFGAAFAAGSFHLNARWMLSVMALLCVCLLTLTFAFGVFNTPLTTVLPDMDVSQPVAVQLATDAGNAIGYGLIDRDADALFGVTPMAVACFFAIFSLTVLMNENGRERFIHKKRIGSSD